MDISICKFYFIFIARKSSKHTFLGLRSNKVFQPVQHWRVKSKPIKSFIHSTAIKRIWYSTGNADPVLARVTVTVFLSFPRYTIAVFDRGMDCDRDDTATVWLTVIPAAACCCYFTCTVHYRQCRSRKSTSKMRLQI